MSRPAGSAARRSAGSTIIAATSRYRRAEIVAMRSPDIAARLGPRAEHDQRARRSAYKHALLSQGRLDEPHSVLARPLGGPGDRSDLATRRIDEQRRRHAEGAADQLQILKYLRGRIRIIDK